MILQKLEVKLDQVVLDDIVFLSPGKAIPTDCILEHGEIEVNESKIAKNVINNNLLINGDFRVNQRGKTVYERASGRVYTVDRWSIWNSNGTFNAETKSLTNLAASGNIMLSQYLHIPSLEFAKSFINGLLFSLFSKSLDNCDVMIIGIFNSLASFFSSSNISVISSSLLNNFCLSNCTS